jgi:hypothetical protein
MYEVIMLHHPFENKSKEEIKTILLKGEYPIIKNEEKLYDDEMIKTINLMLKVLFLFFIILLFYFS